MKSWECSIQSSIFFPLQVIEAMEQKLRRVTEQYDALRDKSDINERRARRAEADLEDIQSRLNNMESDFSSSDIIKDGLRRDKDHVSHVTCVGLQEMT